MTHNVVLFLCTGNYYRSRFAEILFNHLAEDCALKWRAESRGLDLTIGVDNLGPLSAHTRRWCAARGLAVTEPQRFPEAVNRDDLARATLIVAVKEAEHRPYLSRLFPDWASRVRYWHVHDLDCCGPDDALTQLETLVRDLVGELRQSSHP